MKSIRGMILDDEDDLNKDSDDNNEDYASNTDDDFDDFELYNSNLNEDEDEKTDFLNQKWDKPNRFCRRQIKIGMFPPKLVLERRKGDLRIPDNIRPPLQRFRLEMVSI